MNRLIEYFVHDFVNTQKSERKIIEAFQAAQHEHSPQPHSVNHPQAVLLSFHQQRPLISVLELRVYYRNKTIPTRIPPPPPVTEHQSHWGMVIYQLLAMVRRMLFSESSTMRGPDNNTVVAPLID